MLKTLVTATVLTISLSACAAYKTEHEDRNPELVHKSTTITTDKVLVDTNGNYYAKPDRDIVVQKETVAPNGDRIIVRDHYDTDQVIFNPDYPYYGRLKYSQGR